MLPLKFFNYLFVIVLGLGRGPAQVRVGGRGRGRGRLRAGRRGRLVASSGGRGAAREGPSRARATRRIEPDDEPGPSGSQNRPARRRRVISPSPSLSP